MLGKPTLLRNRYEPIEEIGRGGQGFVLRARDTQLGRDVAIKVRALDPDDDRDDVLREAKTIVGLAPHAGLPLVRDDFFADDRYYLVMDWVHGVSLQQILDDKGDPGLGVPTVLGYIEQAAAAIDHLHAHSPPVVHKDVKPANLVLTDRGRLVLVDFGIATRFGDDDRAAGTAGFMAPEVSTGNAEPASDIYGLAATAFALLTGAPPAGARPDWEGVSGAEAGPIERALRRGLAFAPARRPRTATELHERLRTWLRELPTGTVTFLMTDVQDATRLWDIASAEMPKAIARYDGVIEDAVESHRGLIVRSRGEADGRAAVFTKASDAAAAAIAIQRALGAAKWPTPEPILARIALHTGDAEVRDGDYHGPVVNRCARLRGIGHGGQILLSRPTADLVRATLAESATLHDLGAHRLKDLAEAENVFALLHPDLRADFPTLASLDAVPNNLPAQASSFVGREEQLERARQAIADARVVTLVGSGGAGKTRLALQVAADALDRSPDGAWFVELANADASIVAQTVATAMGLTEEPGRSVDETIASHVRTRTMLIILDNCEHVLQAAAALAHTVIRGGSEVRILATSREPLGIPGEMLLQVPPMPVPRAAKSISADAARAFDSVRLFEQRARAGREGFSVTDANAPAIAVICERLDGIPLAIELAAARIRALSPEGIAERLNDRFKLLTGGSHHAMAHHQTLRAAVDWSHELLTPEERMVFARLPVFAGTFSLEAVDAVANDDDFDALDVVASLVDKSLIATEDRGGETRYRMLNTVRDYATERLLASGTTAMRRARHLAWARETAAAAEANLSGPDQARWLRALADEHDNMRAALAWAIDPASGAIENGLRLATSLGVFMTIRGHATEGRAWLERGLAVAPGELDGDVRARALNLIGGFAWHQADYAAAERAFAETLRYYGAANDLRGVAQAANNLGAVAQYAGDFTTARARFEEALAKRREAGDRAGEAECLNNLGALAMSIGELDDARSWLQQALASFRALDDARGIADALSNLGGTALDAGDIVGARAPLEEALGLRRDLDDRRGTADSLANLGVLERTAGNVHLARVRLEESLAIDRELGNADAVASTLVELGTAAAAAGDRKGARASFVEALGAMSESSDTLLLALACERVAAWLAGSDRATDAAALLESAGRLRDQAGVPAPALDARSIDDLRSRLADTASRDLGAVTPSSVIALLHP